MLIYPRSPSQYDLKFTSTEDIEHVIPLIGNYNGALATGETLVAGVNGGALRTMEQGPAILPGHSIVFNKPGTDRTHVLKYNGIVADKLTFYDWGTGGFREVAVNPETHEAELVAGGDLYRVCVDGESIKADMDGDGIVGGGSAHIANRYCGLLELDDFPEPEPATLRFRIPSGRFNGSLDDIVDIHVRKQGQAVNLEIPPRQGITMEYDPSSGLFVGKTKGYGAKVELDTNAFPNALHIAMPDQPTLL
ncbi:MAG: hypothetical protein QXM31_02385 [Candidatus Woesearchaeota archaeon]